MLTVFTPTYNRKNELKNLYSSLLRQNCNCFEWLIVDDGSSDGTKEYVTKIKKEKKIKINYIYKENGGKPSAYNEGVKNAKGDIFLCIDSDDILKQNSIKTIIDDFNFVKNDNEVCGVAYIQDYIKSPEKIIGSGFVKDRDFKSYYNIYHSDRVKGDKLMVLKTNIARQYIFPIIGKEKFIPEALVFNRLSKKYKFYCRNIIAASKDYLDGGYSSGYFNLVKRNPRGNALYFMELYNQQKSWYNVYGYILFSIYAKYSFKKIYGDHPAKFKIVLLYFPTWIVSKLK